MNQHSAESHSPASRMLSSTNQSGRREF
jgi:hypothetical protein